MLSCWARSDSASEVGTSDGDRLAAAVLGQLQEQVLDLLEHPFVERGGRRGDLVEHGGGARSMSCFRRASRAAS